MENKKCKECTEIDSCFIYASIFKGFESTRSYLTDTFKTSDNLSGKGTFRSRIGEIIAPICKHYIEKDKNG